MLKNYEKCFSRIVSFNVILRRYSLLEVPGRRIHNAIAKAMSICVAVGNKVMDTRLPQPAGCGDKYDVDSDVQCGRSMIEMLGVLAIIAVLSVGGIAGYGKAMRMWKSNQQKEQLSQIFATAIRLRYDLSHDKSYNIDKGGNNPIASVFAAIDEVPVGLTYENERMYDKDGNYYAIEYGLRCWWENGKGKVCSFQFIIGVNLIKIQSSLTPSSEDLCVNTIEIAKENAEDVEGITTFFGKEQGSGYYQNNIFLRDDLKQATPSQMLEKCRTCKNHSYCSVSVYLKSH